MHGEYEQAIAPRQFLTLVHLGAVSIIAWLLLGGGLESVAAWHGSIWPVASPARRWLLVACILVFFLRVNITVFCLFQRAIGWGEAALVAGWASLIH